MSDLNESGKLLPTMYLIVFPIYYIKPLPIFFIYNLSLYVQGIVDANSCKVDTTSFKLLPELVNIRRDSCISPQPYFPSPRTLLNIGIQCSEYEVKAHSLF